MDRRTALVLSAVLLFVLLSQWVIFGVNRENWFDVSFSIQTAHLMNEGKGWDMSWFELAFWMIALPIGVGAVCVGVWRWGRE